MIPVESDCRREEWVEGPWIVLEDGQSWSFPPPHAVPDHQEKAGKAAALVVDGLMAMLNVDAIKLQGKAIEAGDPMGALGAMRTVSRLLAVYQAAFAVASDMLRFNYDLSADDCERLMPFNYQLAEMGDPDSKLNRATPETLRMCNRITSVLGVDFGPEIQRIGSSN